MTSRTLIDQIDRPDFRPFIIHMNDGSSFRIDQHWVLSANANSPICVVLKDDGGMDILSVRNIARIETVEETNAA